MVGVVDRRDSVVMAGHYVAVGGAPFGLCVLLGVADALDQQLPLARGHRQRALPLLLAAAG